MASRSNRARVRFVDSLAVALLVVLGAELAGATVDFSGRWIVDPSPPPPISPIVEIAQVGTAITAGIFGTGNVDLLTSSFSVSNSLSGCTLGLGARALPGERVFYGRGSLFCATPFLLSVGPATGTRCECFDGNSTDGDGCSATCQIEPCFTCTGEPSTCAPTGDGGTCSDGQECTSGETCAAGSCGGGRPIPGCFDMGGLWQGTRTVAPPRADLSGTGLYQVTQDRGVVLIDTPQGRYVGSIDVATGAFSTSQVNANFFCISETFSGTVSGDGQSFAGTGGVYLERPGVGDQCDGFATSFTGTRELCGNGNVGAAEQCDDGNTDSGDGCTGGCTIETCWTCDGASPSSCSATSGLGCDDGNTCTTADVCSPTGACSGTPEIDGAACNDESACTAGVCQAGICQPAGALQCEPCLHCVVGSGCQPRIGFCVPPERPEQAILRLVSKPSSDAVSWRLTGGSSVTPESFGSPESSTGYALCVFDQSQPTPQLLFRSILPAGGTCGGTPCWSEIPGRGFRFADSSAAGRRTLAMTADRSQRARIRFSMRGPALAGDPGSFPTVPLALPLRVELQGDGGTCFAANYTPAGVLQNDATKQVFRGRATP